MFMTRIVGCTSSSGFYEDHKLFTNDNLKRFTVPSSEKLPSKQELRSTIER